MCGFCRWRASTRCVICCPLDQWKHSISCFPTHGQNGVIIVAGGGSKSGGVTFEAELGINGTIRFNYQTLNTGRNNGANDLGASATSTTCCAPITATDPLRCGC